jgi:hypothetical protein
MDRRSFLRLMLASAAAEAVDWERLVWTPQPIITVPELPALPGTYGAIIRSEYPFWRTVSTPFGPSHDWLKRAFLDIERDNKLTFQPDRLTR